MCVCKHFYNFLMCVATFNVFLYSIWMQAPTFNLFLYTFLSWTATLDLLLYTFFIWAATFDLFWYTFLIWADTFDLFLYSFFIVCFRFLKSSFELQVRTLVILDPGLDLDPWQATEPGNQIIRDGGVSNKASYMSGSRCSQAPPHDMVS